MQSALAFHDTGVMKELALPLKLIGYSHVLYVSVAPKHTHLYGTAENIHFCPMYNTEVYISRRHSEVVDLIA